MGVQSGEDAVHDCLDELAIRRAPEPWRADAERHSKFAVRGRPDDPDVRGGPHGSPDIGPQPGLAVQSHALELDDGRPLGAGPPPDRA